MANFLCLAYDFKGPEFMRTLKRAGHRVFVVTREEQRAKPWPRESIDEMFYGPGDRVRPHDRQQLIDGTAWLMREHGIDCVVALDDFDVETAALIREEFRIPGMGQSTARFFRDKLAMRMLAAKSEINAPAFTDLFRRGAESALANAHPGPYVVKPRSEASAAGIRKVASANELADAVANLGERAYAYLAECFTPGRVYHVDTLVHGGEIVFGRASQYVDPPLSIVQGGGLFQTRTLAADSPDNLTLLNLTGRVMRAFGLRDSASHTEWIRTPAGGFHFLETGSRVGGAYISNMIQAATGVDLWSEWAKLEAAALAGTPYQPPSDKGGFAAVTIRTVSEQEPSFTDLLPAEAVEEVRLPYHVGAVVSAPDAVAVEGAQKQIAHRFTERYA